jgi:hypothetical protein
MDWDSYIASIVSSAPKDWIAQRGSEEMPNSNYKEGEDDDRDAWMFRSIRILKSDFSISIRIPTRLAAGVNILYEDESVPGGGKFFYDSFELLWNDKLILFEAVAVYVDGMDTRIVPNVSEVSHEQWQLYRLINILKTGYIESREVERLRKEIDEKFSLYGRQVSDVPWPDSWLA